MRDHTPTPILNIRLGDLVALPDGRQFSVRARCSLPTSAASIAGFILLGEFEALLTTPAMTPGSLGLYVPSPVPAFRPDDATHVAAYGSMNYWSPHLPPLENAMASIDYELVVVRGSVTPHFRLLRSAEEVYFCPSTAVDPAAVLIRSQVAEAEAGPANLRQGWSPLAPEVRISEHSDNLYERATRRRPGA